MQCKGKLKLKSYKTSYWLNIGGRWNWFDSIFVYTQNVYVHVHACILYIYRRITNQR